MSGAKGPTPPADELSPLAAAMVGHLGKNPSHAAAMRRYLAGNAWPDDKAPYWVALTLWCHDLIECHPTLEQADAAARELGDRGMLRADLLAPEASGML